MRPSGQSLLCPLCVLIALPILLASTVYAQQTELDRYIAKPDSSYHWKTVKRVTTPGATTWIVDMTSQTWRTADEVDRPTWQHWLIIVKPDDVRTDTGLLFITGGSNGGDPPAGPDERTLQLALMSHSVVATLKMVPNQPLVFHGDGHECKEDDLVAYTWDQYFKTGDPTWPARNPMVKSAVRAMDTITAAMGRADAGNTKVDKFVVAGGSKRGWTTWLTGVVDPRVVAIIPIVIDVLNVEKSMRHHYAAYGFWAPSVGDYVHHKIFPRMNSPRMKSLQELVDPYYYRNRLKMPKYIMNGSGDQFFLPDSSRFYFDELKGKKYLRYFPNADHSLNGTDAVQNLLAFYLTVLKNKPCPEVSWSFADDGSIQVKTDRPPARVLVWQATNPKARDFRVESLGKKYTSTILRPVKPNEFIARVARPARGWTAFFVELTYDIGEKVPFVLTTGVRVVPDTLPFADKDPTRED